jgi:N-acetylmuramoyl-L-alanine amidase
MLVARRIVVIWVTRSTGRRLFLAAFCFIVVLVSLQVAGQPFGFLAVTGSLTDRISGRLIVIDPGHGGHDPGAVAADGSLEKDIVLNIAKHLERYLNQAAVHTILTREGDLVKLAPGRSLLSSKRQDLIQRVEMANKAKADLFISIHCNSFPQSIWAGAQTFYYPGQAESKRLAVAIQSELVRRLGPNRRQANAGDYRVLKDTHMPAVVVEVGFLSNPREARLLADPSYQKKVAEAIYWGILRYY